MKIAGRMVLFRDMGKTDVCRHCRTTRAGYRLLFREEMMGVEEYKRMIKMIDLGDFIGVHGERFTTQKGEPTVLVKEWTMLSKTLRQPPEKWHGLSDRETLYRKRYLDTMSNRESFERFMFRSAFIRAMREFYWENGYIKWIFRCS